MATAGVNRMMLWTDLEGRVLEGRWRLVRLVRPEGRVAWFEAAGADGKPMMLSITETLNDDEELVARLRAAAEIHHPNVVEIREALATHIDDSPAVVAAMEWTEENLADVLRERTLGVAEAQTVLDALIQGMAALHARGLVHARMETASVLATGDTIKLRSDCVFPGGVGFAVAAAENVRAVGRIVTQAVTRRVPAGENDPLLQLLPEPMARTIRRALSGNARIEEIAAIAGVAIVPSKLRASEDRSAPGPGPVAVPQRPPALATIPDPTDSKTVAAPGTLAAPTSWLPQLSAGEATPVANSIEEVNSGAGPAAPAKVVAISGAPARMITPDEALPARQPDTLADETSWRAEDDEPRDNRRRSIPWVIAGAALLLLATLWALYGMMHPNRPAKTAQTTATRSVNPVAQEHPAGSPAAPRAPAAGTVVMTTPGWRVVAYTYNREAQAEHKAQALAQRFPQFSPGVYALHGRAPFLVTLGGVMSRADALALRDRAVQMGLPRDTYAQNYR